MLFLGKRLLHAGLILLGVTLICYLLLFMLPADPARQIAGRSATPEVVENIRHQLGLDLPFYQQPRFYVSTSKSIIKALINMHSFEIQLSPIG